MDSMPLQRVLMFLLATTWLLMSGCGPSEAPTPPAPEPAAAEAEPEPAVELPEVSGRFVAEGWPEIDLSKVEIIALPNIDPTTSALIDQQVTIAQRLHDKLTGAEVPAPSDDAEAPPPPDQSTLDIVLDESDQRQLQAQLNEIKQGFPQVIQMGFSANGSGREYTSRQTLYNRYQQAVARVQVNNLESTLPSIVAMVKGDYETLQQLEQSDYRPEAEQAATDINWLAAFSEHLKDYDPLVRRRYALQKRALLLAQREALREARGTTVTAEAQPTDPAVDWEQFRLHEGARLRLQLYQFSQNTAYLDDRGTFATQGSGPLAALIPFHQGLLVITETQAPNGLALQRD